MMFQEITSRNVEIASPLFPAESTSSQLKEIRIGEPEALRLRSPEKPLFIFILFTLSEIMEIETLTNRYQPYEFKTETVFAEGFYKRISQIQCLIKISKLIEKIIYKDELFKGIDKHKLLKTISKMLSGISVELDEISDEELFERIKRILLLEAMSGILKDLDSQQIALFDEAVKRRPLFK